MREKVLIIDDDEKHLTLTRDILRTDGHDVHVHSRPFGATQAIKDVEPNLILLDINMPGLSGERLVRLWYGNPAMPKVPVVFYSSNDEDSLRRSVMDHGVLGYICKGDPMGLKRKVKYFLEVVA